MSERDSSNKLNFISIIKPLAILVLCALGPTFLSHSQDISNTAATKPLVTEALSNNDDISYHLPAEHMSILPIKLNNHLIDVPIIRYPARQPMVKGVIVLISDIQAQGHIDARLNTVAKSLPEWGWHTILVTPSQAYLTTAFGEEEADSSDKNQTTQNSDEEVKEKVPSEGEQQILNVQVGVEAKALQATVLPYTHSHYVQFLGALGNALNNRFAMQAGYLVVFAKGKSASGFIALMNQDDSPAIDALVLNNIYWPALAQNATLAHQLSELTMPVLDLLSLNDNRWAQQTARDRAVAAKVNLKPLYRQRDIVDASAHFIQPSSIAKELVSWTYFLGW